MQRWELEEDFADRYGPWALVTGGSEGTGAAFAEGLATAGINLVLVARRAEPLDAHCAALRAAHGVEVRACVADLATSEGLATTIDACSGLEIGLVICNAGATPSFARYLDWDADELDRVITLNCRTAVALARQFGEPMRSRGRGGIALVGSMAGFAGSSHQSIYNASKAFVWVLAEGLWHDLGGHGVDVVALVLGATSTPAHDDADFSQQQTMTPTEVAVEGLANLGSGPVHVVGEHNRAVVPYILGRDRAQIVNLMSQSSAVIGGAEHHEVRPRTRMA